MKIKSISPLIITIILILSLWILATEVIGVQKIFLPSVQATLKKLIELSQTNQFWLDVGYSFLRVLFGFLLSIIISYPLMILSLYNKKVKEVVFYIVEFFRYLPIPVFIPLTILWFGVGDYGKIMIVFLGTFAQMIPMYYDSAIAMDNKFDAFTFGLKWSRFKYITKIIIPGSMPAILDNSRLCFGWAWTYLIIAELLGAENGIGYAIIRAQRYLASDSIFAYIIVIGIIGVITDRLLIFTKNKTFKWL
jgi:NitT/TauT family transport system permease protein